MGKLQCELCLSIDIVKDVDYFVCQSCGCKYTIQDARKMLAGDAVKVTGTVKIDRSDEIGNYLANARKAVEQGNWSDAERYYGLVKDSDSQNVEARCYQAFSRYVAALEAGDAAEVDAAGHGLMSSNLVWPRTTPQSGRTSFRRSSRASAS